MDNHSINTTVPQLRFPDFLNDGEWEVKRLGEIAKTFSGGTPSANNKNYYGGNIPFIRSGEINSDRTELFLTQDGLDNSSAKIVEKETILYALYGATSGEVGIAQMKGAINQAILAIIPKEDVDALFLYQFLKSQKKSIVNLYIQGGQGNLSGAIINSLVIPFPPLSEQRRIAQALTALDELIAATNEKLEQMKVYKKGLMQKLFTAKGKKLPEVRFNEFEKDGEWEEKRLGDVVEISDGIHQTPNYTKKGVMFVSVEDISTLKSNKFISEEDFFRDFKVYPQRGDILMTRIGNIGIANVYDKDELLAYYVSLALFKPKSINSYFLKQSIDSYYFQYQLSIKTLHIAFPKKINKTELESILVYCPSIPEQRKIADCLTLIDEMINQYTNKVAILELYKKGLMQQMFPNSK